MGHPRSCLLAMVCVAGLAHGAALAQDAGPPGGSAPAVAAERPMTRAEQERELRKIRARYFRNIRNEETRQVGILKLREFKDAAVFPALLEIFDKEGNDVRFAILDHLRDLKTHEADATLAWAAVKGADEEYRAEAVKRVIARVGEAGEASNMVKTVVAQAIKSAKDEEVVAGATLAQGLGLFEAIPALINAQTQFGRTAGAGNDARGGDLAWILVGTQQAFVSDLEPVVGDSAVAFDPTVSVVTSGTVLRVMDAVVVTYRVDVHNSLVRLANAGWDGRSTAKLGWDNPAWRTWYVNEFKPYRERVEAEERAAARGERDATDADAPGPG